MRYIDEFFALFFYALFCELSEIGESRSCDDLVRRDITIETVESYIMGHHELEVCHEVDECLIIIGYPLTCSPAGFDLRMWGDDHRVDLDLIRTKVTIRPHSSKALAISLGGGSWEILHHMYDDFDARILEKPDRLDRLGIAMSSLRESIDLIDRCLDSDLDTSDTIATKSDDLIRSHPVRSSLYGDTDDPRRCGFIAFLCFFECFGSLRCIGCWYLKSDVLLHDPIRNSRIDDRLS